jgi:hypothetical protein
MIDYTKITNVELDGVDTSDYPDFCDAYIVSADYDGEPMSEKMLEKLNEDGEFVHQKVFEQIY